MKVKIRKGDTVEIINGRRQDKGKRGEVIRVIPETHRIVVQGINIRKKHQRQVQTAQGRQMNPGIIEFEAPLDISNVMVICPNCKQPTRVGVERDDENVPHRVCKQCDEWMD